MSLRYACDYACTWRWCKIKPSPTPRSVSRPARALRTLAVFLVALAGLLAAPPDASAQTEVPADWSLIPTGLGAGDSFRLLFIPSIGTDVDLQGIERYNTYVKARAAAGHADIQAYSHTFRILASTEEVDARDNTSTTTGPGVPIYWLNGAKVADDYEDFYDGSWDEEVMGRRETGVAFTIGSRWQTWTGSAHDGTEFFDTDTTSRAVGNAGNYPVAVGRPNSSTASHGPISGSTADRTLSKGVYALSGVFTVATPPVTVELTSTTTATTTTYAIGDEVEATATFSEAVDITGTPQLELDFAGTPKPAACATGTNTTTMVCGYTVVENDSAPNGIAIAANKLTLNGGTIYATGSATTTADLTHVAVAIDAAHKVDGFRPLFVTTGNDAPTTSTDGTQVILTFTEDISSVDRTRITIVSGTDTLSTSAASAAGTKVELALTTALTTTATNLTVALSADAVEDAAGNGNLAVPAISVTNTVVATTAPTVTSVELTSTATTTTYAIGDEVEATVTFSAGVDITGTPQLELDFAGTPKPAACYLLDSPNMTTMLCGYTVVMGDSAPNGIAIAANKLTLNGGMIYATGSTTTTAVLAHAAVAIDAAHKVDGIRPTLVTTGNDAPATSTDGTKVILTFSEDISSVDRTRITIMAGGNVASTSTASVAGTTVELALTTALTATTTNLTVALSADAVEDAAANGNLAVPATSVTNTVGTTTAPTVTSVDLTSTATTTTYAIGDEVEATVTFSEAVDITGTPQLELDFAGTPKPAACTAATNTTTMVCEYEVMAGDSAPNGIAIAANKLTGGTITATGSTTNNAVLDHAAVAIDAAHKVDGIRPTLVTTGNDAPTTSIDGTQVILTFSEDISSVDRTNITIMAGGNVASTSAASAAGAKVELALTTALTTTTTNLTVALSAAAVEDAAANGNLAVSATPVTNAVVTTTAPTVTSVELTSTTTTYAIGDEVEATVTFSAGVDITGTPQLELDFAGTPKPAACAAATNTTTMVCSYTVVAGDSAPNGIAIAANKLTGGTITATGSTTNNAVLDHAAVAIDAAHKVDGIRPTLVTTGNDAPATSTDGTQVILTFSEDISSVDRTRITIMAGGNVASTSTASVAGTTVELALTTALTATTTNLTVALSADAVEDAAANGNLAVPAISVTNTVGVTTAPTVTSVDLTSTSTATTTTYAIGDEVEATVTFSEAVDITGTPQLELDFAGTPKPAACGAATNTTTMLCGYTVVMGDSAPNGIAIAADKLTLNGGTITATGSTTNNADLGHAAVAIDAAHAVANTVIVPNAPPAFQAESTTREVAENSAAGTNVGDPVTATDSGDTLTYTLEGTDAASFDIVSTSGQIRTKSGVTYDYETKSSYALTVRAEDRNGGSDTIAVTITVTDVEDSPAVRGWLGRFGRTVSGQVLDAVEERLRATRAAGVSVRVAGQSIDLATKAAPEDEAEKESRSRLAAVSDRLGQETQDGKRAGMQSRTPTGPEAMMGSSFALAAKTHGGGSAVVWGRMAQSRFSGRAGGLSLDSDVTTGLLGAEYARGPLAGGAVLSNSRGKGGYGGDAAGRVAASMTALTPWAGYKVSERLSVWGALGYGAGELTLTPKAQPGQNTDLAMRLAAGGARGTVVDGDGPKLDAVADARWVRTTSEKVSSSDGHLAATSADVTRLRLGLEGSWAMTLDDQGATVTPRLSFGVRHDGGDAETGFGADIGGGVLLAMPARGLSVSLEGRGLLVHEAKGFIDTGFGASVAWDQAPSSKRGLSLTVRHSVGGSATGGKDALFSREVMDGLAANGNQRLEGRVGYGLAVYGDRFTGTPELGYGLSDSGRDLSLGWRLTREGRDAGSFGASLETTRRETANDNDPEHGIGFRLTARW